MPKKTYYAYKKKRATKRKSNYGKSFMMKVPSGMPLQRRAYLRYSQGVTVTSTSGVPGHHIFRANGVYDPDSTGVGSQPMGRDEWAALFNHTCVVRCRMTAYPIFGSPGDVQSTYGVTISDDGTTPYSDWTGYSEAKKGSVKFHSTYERDPGKVISYYDAKKFYNLKDIKDNVDRVGAAVGANPSEGAFFDLWFQTLDGSTNSIQFACVLDYVIDWSEPKDLAQS